MELLNTATSILILQVLFLPIQIWSYLTRYQDQTRMRFLVLNLVFILFNILFSLKYVDVGINQVLHEELYTYFGIALFGYLYYYIAVELDRFKTINLIKLMIIITTIKFIWSCFETDVLTGKDKFVSRLIMAFAIEGVLIWSSCLSLIRRTFENEIKSIPFVICSRVILLMTLSLPFTLFLVKSIEFQIITLNTPFFVLSFGYYWHSLQLIRKENEVVGQNSPSNLIEQNQLIDMYDIHTFGLKGALLEIAELLVDGYSQDEIASERQVTPASTRNQCCKIYKIIGVKDLKEFRVKFNVTPRHQRNK